MIPFTKQQKKNRQKECMVMEMKREATLGGCRCPEGHEGLLVLVTHACLFGEHSRKATALQFVH